MNRPAGVIDTQLDALLELVEKHREERCRAILQQAEEKRRELLAEAHSQARRHMHEAVQSERHRARSELTAARASAQTRARQQQYRTALGLLREAWDRLGEAMAERWSTPETRLPWIRALVAEAMVVLPQSQCWRIEYPAAWDPSEMEEEMERMTAYCQRTPELIPREDLHAGLRFCTDGACLDGSVEGLLIDRTGVESRLLAEVNRLLGGDILGMTPQSRRRAGDE